MLDNRVQHIGTLDPHVRHSCPVLIDANALDDFLAWIEINPDFERRVREERAFQLSVLVKHVESRSDWKKKSDVGLCASLKRLGFEHLSYNATPDETFINEVQRAYFGNDATARKSAELLACARRKSNDHRPARIVSRHSGFRSVPGIHLYVFDLEEIGIESDAVLMREYASLGLHRKVVDASFNHIRNLDYSHALLHL